MVDSGLLLRGSRVGRCVLRRWAWDGRRKWEEIDVEPSESSDEKHGRGKLICRITPLILKTRVLNHTLERVALPSTTAAPWLRTLHARVCVLHTVSLHGSCSWIVFIYPFSLFCVTLKSICIVFVCLSSRLVSLVLQLLEVVLSLFVVASCPSSLVLHPSVIHPSSMSNTSLR